MVSPGTNSCGRTISFQQDSPLKVKEVENQNCMICEDDHLQSWRGRLLQHQDRHGKDEEESTTTRAGRALRTNKCRKVAEDIRQKKQLFTPEIKKLLKEWLVRRRRHPYPNRNEKKELALKTGLTYMQICNWFANWRRKLRKTMTGVDSWGRLITGYNRQVQGNCEQFSISSHDSIWDETNYNHHNNSESNPETSLVSRSLSSANEGSLEHVEDEHSWISHCQGKPSAPERPATSALVKWLESAARFRPREVSWSTDQSCWGGSLLSSKKLRRPRGRLRSIRKSRGRHREELDAAEALTFLSVSAHV